MSPPQVDTDDLIDSRAWRKYSAWLNETPLAVINAAIQRCPDPLLRLRRDGCSFGGDPRLKSGCHVGV